MASIDNPDSDSHNSDVGSDAKSDKSGISYVVEYVPPREEQLPVVEREGTNFPEVNSGARPHASSRRPSPAPSSSIRSCPVQNQVAPVITADPTGTALAGEDNPALAAPGNETPTSSTPPQVQIFDLPPRPADTTANLSAEMSRIVDLFSKFGQSLEDSKVLDKLASISASGPHKEELDPAGQEMGPTAKIWDIYIEEAKHFDDEMLETWNKGLDVLLVFAGLFSSILTTFLVQASTLLSPDPSIATNTLLNEILVLLNSTANRSSLVSLTTFTLSPTARWVNGLWFSSLALALSSALLSILAKQWLQAYRPIKRGDIPRENARRRERLLRSFESWHVGAIIDTTPIILHFALLLFFAGLIVFVWTLDSVVAATTVAIIGSASAFYGSTLLLPALFNDCPYTTPALDHGKALLRAFYRLNPIRLWHRRDASGLPYRYEASLFSYSSYQFFSAPSSSIFAWNWRLKRSILAIMRWLDRPLLIILTDTGESLGSFFRPLYRSMRRGSTAVLPALRSFIRFLCFICNKPLPGMFDSSWSDSESVYTETDHLPEEELLDIEMIAWLARGSTSVAGPMHEALFYAMAGLPKPKTQRQHGILTQSGIFPHISRVYETRELYKLALTDVRYTEIHCRALLKASIWRDLDASAWAVGFDIADLMQRYMEMQCYPGRDLQVPITSMSRRPRPESDPCHALLTLANWDTDIDERVSLLFSFVLLSGFFLSPNRAWTFQPSSSIENIPAEYILNFILEIECQYIQGLEVRREPGLASGPGLTALYVAAAHTLYCALRIQSHKYLGIRSHFHPNLLDDYLLLAYTELIQSGSLWLRHLRRSSNNLSMVVEQLGRVIVPLSTRQEDEFLLIPDTSALTSALDTIGKITEEYCDALSEAALLSLRDMWFCLICDRGNRYTLRNVLLGDSMLRKLTTELPLLRAVLHLFASGSGSLWQLSGICDCMFDFERGISLYPFFTVSGVNIIFGVVTQQDVEHKPGDLVSAIEILVSYSKKLISMRNDPNSIGTSHTQVSRSDELEDNWLHQQVDGLFQCDIMEHFSRNSGRDSRVPDAYWSMNYLDVWLKLLHAMYELRPDHNGWFDVFVTLQIESGVLSNDDDDDDDARRKRVSLCARWRGLREIFEQEQPNSLVDINNRNSPAPHSAVDMSVLESD